MSYSPFQSDGMSGTRATIAATTPDNAGGGSDASVWSAILGGTTTIAVAAGVATCGTLGGGFGWVIGTYAAVSDQRVSGKMNVIAQFSDLLIRSDGTGANLVLVETEAATGIATYYVRIAGSFTSKGSSSGWANGDVVRGTMNAGTSLDVDRNGSSVSSGVAMGAGALSTGTGGFGCFNSVSLTAGVWDDFLFETAAVAATQPWFILGPTM